MKLIVFVACVYLLGLCCAATSQVSEGVDVSGSDYPWVANLAKTFDGDTDTFCTGSLIEKDPPVVLTAAHCVENFRWNSDSDSWESWEWTAWGSVDISADLGRTYLLDDSDLSYATLLLDDEGDIVIHPDYGDAFGRDNDLALIILASDEYLTTSSLQVPALPAQLSEDTACCTSGDAFTILGYGFVDSEGNRADQLQRSTLAYITEDLCESYFGNRFDVGNDVMCTLSDECSGESGEPVIQGADNDGSDVELAGVSSHSRDSYCSFGTPSLATSVAQYRTWIDDVIASYRENGALHESRNTRLVKLLQAHGYNGRVILMLAKDNPFKVVFFIVGLMVVICGMVFKHKNGCRSQMGKDFAAYERIPDSDEEAVW